jgi:hypothetical protein
MSDIQNYDRLYYYVHEYQNLLYNYYSKHVVRFLVTYYNLNVEETIWDDENVFGGAYEQTGELAGVRRNKILLLPVYYPEEVTTAFDGEDIGYNKNTETTIVIPSSYGFKPYPHDMLKFEQEYLQHTNDTYPLYTVTGVEIHPNTDRRYWRLKCQVYQSETLASVDSQVIDTYSFVEYTKQIHTLADAQFISRLMYKDSILRPVLKNTLYDDRVGFYFTPRTPQSC